jgi:hypothetical protein
MKEVRIMYKILVSKDKGRYSFADLAAVKKKSALGKQDVKFGEGLDRIRAKITVADGF